MPDLRRYGEPNPQHMVLGPREAVIGRELLFNDERTAIRRSKAANVAVFHKAVLSCPLYKWDVADKRMLDAVFKPVRRVNAPLWIGRIFGAASVHSDEILNMARVLHERVRRRHDLPGVAVRYAGRE